MAFEHERETMVAQQLAARGIRDVRVLDAVRAVPRHAFVPPAVATHAYDDMPLPIGEDQTISQPYMVALMSEALGLGSGAPRVLEVGTGSGYQAAVLAAMGVRVISLERIPALALRARGVLAQLGFADRVRVIEADGSLGWPDEAPYDGILVAAAAPELPRPLLSQLGVGRALVVPIGRADRQLLVRVRRDAEGLREDYLGECRFMKLRGEHGWKEPDR